MSYLPEVLAPNKVSKVSYLRRVKDLSLHEFINTTPELYKLYKEILQDSLDKDRICYRIRRPISNIVISPSIRTGTCLSYLILTIPLVRTIKYANDCAGIPLTAREATKLIPSETPNETAEDFYNALRAINPSYINKYVGSLLDVRDRAEEVTLLNAFRESSYWGLIVYDVMHNFEITLEAYRFMTGICRDGHQNILTCISDIQLYSISKSLDSEVLKGFNPTTVAFIKSHLSIIRSLSDIRVRNLLKDLFLRINNINLGALSDILALVTSFTIISKSNASSYE